LQHCLGAISAVHLLPVVTTKKTKPSIQFVTRKHRVYDVWYAVTETNKGHSSEKSCIWKQADEKPKKKSQTVRVNRFEHVGYRDAEDWIK